MIGRMPEFVLKALLELNNKGYSAYLVGGAARDLVLNKVPKDYDLTTNARPEKMLEVFKDYRVIPTGLKHGTITVMFDKEEVEITTYRIDGIYSDNRRPDNVQFTPNLLEDLSRRDFTMNSIAISPKDGSDELSLIDPFNGLDDIKNKVIRCVGDPERRFNEDALRILRALRFASKLGFSIEEKTDLAIHKLKHLLLNISPERIQKEFNGILIGDNVKYVLKNYSDVIGIFIPEMTPSINFNQYNPYHKNNVYDHMVEVVSYVENDLMLRLAAFFHDIGKPCTVSRDPNSEEILFHFYKHARASEKICINVMQRLKYSNDEIEDVSYLVLRHDMELIESKKLIKRALSKIPSLELLYKLLLLKEADSSDHNHIDGEIDYNNIRLIIEEILKDEECFSLRSLGVNGYHIKSLGFKDKQIGDILNFLLDAVIEEEVENTESALLEYVKVYVSGLELLKESKFYKL